MWTDFNVISRNIKSHMYGFGQIGNDLAIVMKDAALRSEIAGKMKEERGGINAQAPMAKTHVSIMLAFNVYFSAWDV
jgi:hypothetical protein